MIIAAVCIFGAQVVQAGEVPVTGASDVEKKPKEEAYQMEKVTVTAQKRLENVQDVPESMTVLE